MWNTISYIMLAISTIFAMADGELALAQKAICLVFSITWGSWYWVFVVGAGRWRGRPHLHGAATLAAILVLGGMCWVHPAYLFLLFGFYGVAFSILSIVWASISAVTISLVGATRIILLNGGFRSESLFTILIFTVSAGMSILLGLFIHAIIRQSSERQKMIEDLQAARSELAQAERQAGILEERQRLAAVIHDTLAQSLTSIIMHLEAGENFSESDPARAKQHLDRARSTARASLEEARRFVWATQPEIPHQEPLSKALERLLERWTGETGLPVTLQVEGESRALPAPYQVIVLRATQEGLANIHKHASASQVNLTLTYMEDELFLDMHDNGQGFDPTLAFLPNAAGGGYGLFSLRERARQVGGSLAVESAPTEGTTLTLQLPLSENQEKTG